ncbi:MAG: galactokinase [bacterium]
MKSFENLAGIYRKKFGNPPSFRARAPGRVNLIGEHTDYNEGFVFPAALECEVRVAAGPAIDGKVRLFSVDFNEEDRFEASGFSRNAEKPWTNYVRGVLQQMLSLGARPFNAVISGNVPLGSGLSSSAALEVATAFALNRVFGLSIPPVELALLCQRAENQFVGVQCGIMDQFISALGRENHALLIDCRDLSYRPVPLNLEGHSLVIADSRAPRELAASAYNERRAECEEGVRLLGIRFPGIRALRDVTGEAFQEAEGGLPEPIRRRCRHVVSENIRTLEAARVLSEGDLARFGELMTASHVSLRDDYKVSSEYLDLLVETALDGEECLGSRLTGAGFGGCTVSLVRSEGVPGFKERLTRVYRKKTDLVPVIYVSRACRGAEAEAIKG